MSLSIIIPAHNEERFIEATIKAASNLADEIIVADDASTDHTAELARTLGARVIASGKRNIGATRNIGARAAHGDRLLFLDADTIISAKAVAEMNAALESGAVAGGAPLRWDGPVPMSARFAIGFWNGISRLFRAPAGGFFFMTREAFEKTGGFDESFYVSEELWLGRALRSAFGRGRVAIIETPVTTSARKLRTHSQRELLAVTLRLILTPFRAARDRNALGLWYERR